MSTSDRYSYLTATVLDQTFLDNCADNLTNQLELICDIEAPDGSIIRASDRNKYVGEYFYEALVKFPVINRTLGEWLSPELEFSTLQIELSNADGRYNKYLPGGASYGSWIGNSIEVKIGLRDVASTYKTIFKGYVTQIGGAKRTIFSIVLVYRNQWDRLAIKFPNVVFSRTQYPYIENNIEGKVIPFILGDWSTALQNDASVPGFVVNGIDPNVFGGIRNNVRARICINVMSSFIPNKVYLRRSSNLYLMSAGDIVNIAADKNAFEIIQNGITTIEGGKYFFETGDEFFVQVRGPDLSGFRDNVVAQCQNILESYSGIVPGDYAPSWGAFKTKGAPSYSAIYFIKSRVWIQDPQDVITYVLSMLEQVRLEAFVDRDAKLALTSMHLEDWDATPSFVVRNWDVERNSFQLTIDDKTNFNRIQAAYDFEPIVNENALQTGIYKNQAAINQVGSGIYQKIVFPNLYVKSDVENQIVEILRISSGAVELVMCNLTWRAMLLELGDQVALNVQIGSAVFAKVPCLVRDIAYNPDGIKIEVKLISLQMIPFAGWNPGYNGIVGGMYATIVAE